MIEAQILDIFYTKVVPEAQKGKIDCYFMTNMAFNELFKLVNDYRNQKNNLNR